VNQCEYDIRNFLGDNRRIGLLTFEEKGELKKWSLWQAVCSVTR
jgi:hypothetical protein